MIKEQLTILLLGGARRVSLADQLKRSGERIGCDVKIVSYELSEEVPIALEGKVVKGLKWEDPNVVDDIVSVVKEYDVRVILPFVNGAIEIASICRERLPEVFVPVTDFEIASVMFDKLEAAKAFKAAGFPIPRTFSILSAELPAIVKPRKGGSSRGIHIFRNMEDLMHLEGLQDHILQEYIEHSREYTVDSYIDKKGRILVTVPRERLEVMGGESTRTRTCHNSILEDMSREVINKFKLRGPVNLQFLHDLDADRYLLMEANPRLGGGVLCSIFAGAPITDYIIQEALGVEPQPVDNWDAGTLVARYFKEAVFYEKE